jgi:hypothetical protein
VLGEVVRALGRLTLDEVNTLRGRVGLNLRTEAQLLDAVKDLVQGQPWTLGNPSVLTAAQQRAGLGLGDSATRHVGEAAGTVCAGDDARLAAVAGEAFPVGSVFITVVATDPATLLGYGTWQAFGAGRVLVGIDAGDPDFDTVEETGGTKDVALTEQQIPAHSHLTQRYPQTTGPNSGFTADTSMNGAPTANTLPTAATGGGQAHTNLQPYILVHMWKRTA